MLPRTGVLREKSALTTEFVSGIASPYSDTGNTEDSNVDFSSSGGTADKLWLARKWTAPVSGRIKNFSLVLGKTGSPAGAVAGYLFTDDGQAVSMPDAVISEATGSVAASALSANANGLIQAFTWGGDLPEVVASGVYWALLKTSGYSYEDGVTEIRLCVDADGATGLNEVAKYDHDASPRWTSVGANVGADLVVEYEDGVIVTDGGNALALLVDFTKGSSGGMDMKIEFSVDNGLTWYQETVGTLDTGVTTHAAHVRRITDTSKRAVVVDVHGETVRVSVKAITDATDAQVGIKGVCYSK